VNDVSSDEGLKYFKRIAGADRYETMRKIVEASYKIGGDYYWQANVAVVASGDNFPDALAANGLAGALNGGDGAPVILTKKGALSAEAKTLLKKLSVQTVYIMGGTAAISAETEQAIKDMKIATVRVAGADRQATSVEAFKLIDGNWYKNHGTHSVIIATGANYADALSIAPFAYKTGTPVVLTKADGTLTDEAVKAIKDNDEIWQVIVVGGTSVVSDSVFSVLGTYSGNYKDYYNKVYVPVRIAGADRYDTSAKIADWEVKYAFDIDEAKFWNTAGFSFDETFIATGENFPDALAGGQLAGGKYYADPSVKATIARWGVAGWVAPTAKPSSPILLTKDGNRAADSVIASNLAWNWSKRSVDAYEFINANIAEYFDDYLNGGISADVAFNDADGFFTYNQLSANTLITDFAAWIDGYRVVDNNFNGIIFGGKAAVSKDKAKQLDETVADSILKIQDPVGSIDYDYVTVNGVKYRTLSWLFNNKTNWFSNIGVNGIGNATGAEPWNDTFTAEEVFAVPANQYGYLYQPYATTVQNTSFDTTANTNTNGKVLSQTVTIGLAEFTNLWNSTLFTNDYTGYSFTGTYTMTFTVNYTYNANGSLNTVTYANINVTQN
jgi:putative cell wall-binding protein